MLKPGFHFFIIPLGAICTFASLSAPQTAPGERSVTHVRQQVTDCSSRSIADPCGRAPDDAAVH